MRSSPNLLTLFLVLAAVGSMGFPYEPLSGENRAAIAESLETAPVHAESAKKGWRFVAVNVAKRPLCAISAATSQSRVRNAFWG